MMIAHNVSDHWFGDEPAWVKSLVSSPDRRHGRSSVLPLTVVAEKILSWVALASGPDASRKSATDSSQLDVAESAAALGGALRAEFPHSELAR